MKLRPTILVLLTMILLVTAFAEFTYSTNNGGITITGYMGKIVTPASRVEACPRGL